MSVFPPKKKIFILLPDGVGLKNFAFTSFVEIGKQKGWDVIFWNTTPFNLNELELSEIKLQAKPRAQTDLLKRAKINLELDHFADRFEDPTFRTYRFTSSPRRIKGKIKKMLVSYLENQHRETHGLEKLRDKLKMSERKGAYYRHCLEVLKSEKPALVFCTNQRPVTAIAPLTAAQDLGIPTTTFIFSWDNLPKATMVVEPDHYLVWSDYMKQELLKYYPFIGSENIHPTGSPQFEPHYNPSLRKTRKDFFYENGLDLEKEYICFSGDDITTCPDDPQYLDDMAQCIRSFNQENHKLGIIFRRSPVDLSGRYNAVLSKHDDIIVPLSPKWKKVSDNWNSILPTEDDLGFQVNTILHSKLVINLASSMVFDFAIFDKPCLYLNYNVEKKQDEKWSPQKVYNFVHFRSMPTENCVIWINSKTEIKEKLELAMTDGKKNAESAQEWFQKINQHPPQEASKRIWNCLDKLVKKSEFA